MPEEVWTCPQCGRRPYEKNCGSKMHENPTWIQDDMGVWRHKDEAAWEANRVRQAMQGAWDT